MTDRLDLAALVASRICHDLISPIGAIGNGVELISLEGVAAASEMALISESVASANARIRFFRIAFGACGQDQRIGRSEVSGLLADMAQGGRIKLVWDSPSELARRDVKLALLLHLCLENAMPYGGEVSIIGAPDRWVLHASSPKLRVNTALWDWLQGETDADIGPAQVRFALVPEELARQNRRLTSEIGETEIRLSF